MKFPKISVITPSFNSIHTIEETIQSVLNQNYPNLEHIVIDGGSTDGTVELLKKHPHLIWRSERDEGLYHAMNKGITHATGELIVILNSDDYFRPEALLKTADAFQKNPAWDASFGDVVYVDGQGQEIFRREEAGYSYNVLRYWQNYICHQTLFVRKATYDKLGLYRHHEFLYGCDYEFILRLGREKYIVGHVRAFLVNFRYHDYGLSADLRVVRDRIDERKIIQREYGVPACWSKLLSLYGRSLRQFQKLLYLGKCDLIPGYCFLRKHMRKKTQFSSNSGVNRLEL